MEPLAREAITTGPGLVSRTLYLPEGAELQARVLLSTGGERYADRGLPLDWPPADFWSNHTTTTCSWSSRMQRRTAPQTPEPEDQ